MALPILHFSDVLCIYAYVAQVRTDELEREFGDAVALEFHFCQVFGNTERKIREGWAERGGFAGYNAHVQQVAARFDHVELHPEVWTKAPPTGSLSPHLFIKAVETLEARGEAARGMGERAARLVRRAFFQQARNVSAFSEQLAIAEELGLAPDLVRASLEDGSAHAALSGDLDLARQHAVSMSPTLIFNDGRQRLNGNVGFRIIEANVRELLRAPEHEASWC